MLLSTSLDRKKKKKKAIHDQGQRKMNGSSHQKLGKSFTHKSEIFGKATFISSGFSKTCRCGAQGHGLEVDLEVVG